MEASLSLYKKQFESGYIHVTDVDVVDISSSTKVLWKKMVTIMLFSTYDENNHVLNK